MFQDFYDRGMLDRSLNEIFVCLIPKKERVTEVKDFRLISSVTSGNKIIAKVLANRLKKVVSLMISDSQQRAFAMGRQILD